MALINKLLNQHILSIYRTATGILYKLNSQEEAKKMANLRNDDLNVYQVIRAAGNVGIWIKDLRWKTGMINTALGKIIKTLESKKLIKSVKSAETNRKVYLAYDIEAAAEVTGGIWYDGSTFDQELFNVLYNNSIRFIEHQPTGSATAVDVSNFFRQSGLVSTNLGTGDIAAVLHAAALDGKLEPIARQIKNVDRLEGALSIKPSNTRQYKVSNTGVPRTDLASVPCASCPISKQCSDGGTISPQSCSYLKEWMEF